MTRWEFKVLTVWWGELERVQVKAAGLFSQAEYKTTEGWVCSYDDAKGPLEVVLQQLGDGG